jgi:hypothetical protein
MLLSLLLAAFLAGEALPGSEAAGGHGMLVFGSGAIYASHLPMFMPKHRYQAVFEVSFGAAGDALYRAERQSLGDAAIFTLDPTEAFRMPELEGSRTSFSADVFAGHFERPGHRRILQGVTVTLVRRFAWHPFRRAHIRPESLTYLVAGTADELYLVHWISKAPDYDQVLAAKRTAPLALDGECELVVPGRPDERPLVTGERAAGLLSCDLGSERPRRVAPVELAVGAQLYLERDELHDDGLDAAP